MPITIKDINVLRNSTWSAWAENIALVLTIALTFYSFIPVNVPNDKAKKIIISHHATVKDIISQLRISGYDLSMIDQIILRFVPHLQEGELHLKHQTYHRIDFLYQLSKAQVPLYKITLVPGETKEIFLKGVAQKLDINGTKLLNAYHQLAPYPEAAIAADTYLVPKKMNEKNLIKFLLKNSDHTYTKLIQKNQEDYNSTQWQRILTIASIIQKEAANTKEMPLIASVIYNRLEKNMRLQMDGTLNYGNYSHIKVTPERIKSDSSSFNTYKHRGLPKSPIGSVSKSAITAAMHPAETTYLFFMRNKEGVHDFADTFKKHRKNIQKAK